MGKGKLEIKKRSSEEIVCWHVEGEEITPNTVLESGAGITLLVKAEGKTKVCMKNSTTVYALFNPGKETKLLGGNKPYGDCQIYAIDQTSEFCAEWGLAGADAIPCTDSEYGVDCTAVAFGKYFYKIDNFYNFTNALSCENSGKITRDDVREFLRAETSGVIKGYLSGELAAKGVKACHASISRYAEELTEEINRKLENKGITVYSFVILQLDYDARYKAQRGAINDTKMFVNLKKTANDGSRDDIEVEALKASNVVIPVVRAINDVEKNKKLDGNVNTDEGFVFCSRCGEKNSKKSNYCQKCGEKLHK
ncbi:zinc-ribbon domain-containing protein [bacterium]|nr:zinc-ribbon domain-containing protein [bacterium]